MRIWILILPAVATCVLAADYSGDYKYAEYRTDVSDTNGASIGVTRTFGAEFTDISVNASNEFSISTEEWAVPHNVSEYLDSEGHVVNSYYAALKTTNVQFSDKLEIGNNNTILINGTPLYFNTTTNVAITFENNDTAEDELAATSLAALVRRGRGFDASSVTGSYVRCTLGTAIPGHTPSQWGDVQRIALEKTTVTCNGAGVYTETGTKYAGDHILSERTLTNGIDTTVCTVGTLTNLVNSHPINTNGSYTVSDNGLLMLNGNVPVQISSDGNAMVSAMGFSEEQYAATYTTFAVKQPASAMSTNGINATYFLLIVYENFSNQDPVAGVNSHRTEAQRIYVTLRSDNTFSIREDDWAAVNRVENILTTISSNAAPNPVASNRFSTAISPQAIRFDSGTYSIATNGVVTLQFNSGDIGQAQLSENGEYLLISNLEGDPGYLERMIGFGVHRTPPTDYPQAIFTDLNMTPTGTVITASLPVGESIDGLYTTDLTLGEWGYGGSHTSVTGTVIFNDSDATNRPAAFYGTTFTPW